MGWAGTGLVWTVNSGVASAARRRASTTRKAAPTVQPFSFVQVSDSHIGFAKDPNPDARATSREAVATIRALPQAPAFILHTGDVRQLSKAAGVRRRRPDPAPGGAAGVPRSR